MDEATHSLRDAPWSPPAEFDEYRLVRPLGRGRTGNVFLAHDTLLERAVAVKFIRAVDSEALARFLNEARAAARIQHPNVVAVYRVGQLDDRAYLVSEYTRGVGLERLKKPIPWSKVLPLARDLARGLAAAHRRGVLHRDVKPGNAILTETGQVKLLDFGLAKVVDPRSPAGPQPPVNTLVSAEGAVPVDSLSGARLSLSTEEPVGALVGTPWYMSPEAWRGEDHTARSDLYSLGAVIFELCAGRPPFAERELPALVKRVEAGQRPTLRELAPEVPEAFAEIVERLLRRDPLERFPSADALVDALEALEDSSAQSARIPEGNPYRGLRSFDAEHRSLFFGRRAELRAVVDRLKSEAFVVLTGDSGVGKSSLAFAGVLPAVEEGALGDSRRYAVVRLVPGRRPVASLAQAAAAFLKEPIDAIERMIRGEREGLVRRLLAATKGEVGVLLYVDQLEELVTVAAPDEAQLFADALAPVAQGVAGVRVLASARSDFLTRLAGLGGFGEALARSLYLVAPMAREQVREAIVGPARVKGARFESEALVDTLVESTVGAGGGLPLLQFALAQLWDARDAVHNQITARSLEAVGGVAGALARHADGVVEALSPEVRGCARSVMLRLLTDDGTRARRSGDELTDGDPRYATALDALVRNRLVVAREGDEGGTFEVAHEALLSGWSTLARWVEEERETRALRRRLESSARDWERTRSAELLWGERALAEAAALGHEALSVRERAFLAASRRAQARRRWLKVAVIAGFMLALVAVGLGMRLKASIDRTRATEAALAAATEKLASARAAEQEEESLRRQAFAAFDASRAAEGEQLWTEALAQASVADTLYAETTDALERAAGLDPRHARVKSALADVIFARAERADRDSQVALRDVLVQRLRLIDAEGPAWRAWNAPAVAVIRTPPGTTVAVARYALQQAAPFELTSVSQHTSSGELSLSLPAGSYLFTATRGEATVKLAVLLTRGETTQFELHPPSAVPAGFVYVPAGRFRYGSTSEESVRQFLNAVPAHTAETRAFLIARHETTWAEYLAFLDALDPRAREAHLPRGGSTGLYGGLRVRKRGDGKWELHIQPTSQMFSAVQGEPLRFPGRTRNVEVDWLRAPVVGITYADAKAYAAWLDGSGKLPGARLCDEREWERAARGADDREYPHGNRLEPDDANHDRTYGKVALAFGPDEVGSHPRSDSPYGVQDLSGNVWEWTASALQPGAGVARGGSYYFAASTCRVTNRESPEANFRDLTVGMRICANAPAP